MELVVENTADDAVPISHPTCVFEAATTADKTFHRINGATHYYKGQPEKLAEALDVLENWMSERSL